MHVVLDREILETALPDVSVPAGPVVLVAYEPQKRLIIASFVKHGLAVIAAVDDVVRQSLGRTPANAGHDWCSGSKEKACPRWRGLDSDRGPAER